MKIRTITSFFDPTHFPPATALPPLAQFSRDLIKGFEEEGFTVQSARIATPPISTYLPGKLEERVLKIKGLESLTQELGWLYLSAGPALPGQRESYRAIPALLAETQNVFFSGVIADKAQVYPQAVVDSAEVIVQAATLSPDGFANLRFAALANVPPFAPFFPAAYHAHAMGPCFSIAIECADEAVSAFSNADSLENAREMWISTLEKNAARLGAIISRTPNPSQFPFKGFDFSPAPYPEDQRSLGKAFENLGLEYVGGAGSLAAAAFIADALDGGNWQRAGFNGLMLAVLEDSVLAARAATGQLTVKDLLLYSAVCGTGLDTIPLPGNSTPEEISAILLDLAALAVRLGKPLTGRLMPIPGKSAGEPTDFNFAYFANSRIMALDSQTLRSPLMSAEAFPLTPRKVNID